MTDITLELGQIVATPGALRALEKGGLSGVEFLVRHAHGDWGEVGAEDWAENEFSVGRRLTILSAYTLPTGVKIWIITEADRSVTTILLPEDY